MFLLQYQINGTIFDKRNVSKEIYLLIFSTTLPETFLILRRIQGSEILLLMFIKA